jgi:hypothetical protein
MSQDDDRPLVDMVGELLPLEVAGATLGTFYLTIRGRSGPRFFGELEWALTVTSDEWWLERDGRVVLSYRDYGYEDDDEAVRFLVGTSLTAVEGKDPDGQDMVFVFDGVYRLRIATNPDGDESYVFYGPEWWFVVY